MIGRWIRYGDLIPPGRVAYCDLAGHQARVLPIGLHLLWRWARRVWEWSLKYRPSTMERLRQAWIRSGHREGQNHGYRLGYAAGVKDTRQSIEQELVRAMTEELKNNEMK